MEKRSFEVVVAGQYHAMSQVTGTPVIKNYEASFILPSQEAALSVICKHLLADKLRAMYPDFIRFRTHELKSITAHGRKPDAGVLQMTIEEMSVSELSDFCILKGIMIDPYKHADLPKVREQVAEAWRVKRQNAADASKDKEAKNIKEAESLRALNQLAPKNEELKINVNEHKATAAVKAQESAPAPAAVGAAQPVEEDAPLPPVVNDDPDFIE